MKFEISEDVMKDMVAMFGRTDAINEIVNSFRTALDTSVTPSDKEEKKETE